MPGATGCGSWGISSTGARPRSTCCGSSPISATGRSTVLGNHDLHLVASARGIRPLRAKDTFRDVLDAADGETLVDWLRERPVIHRDPDTGVPHGPRGHRPGVDRR